MVAQNVGKRVLVVVGSLLVLGLGTGASLYAAGQSHRTLSSHSRIRRSSSVHAQMGGAIPQLSTVSAAELASNGFTLEAPQRAPSVPLQTAELTAKAAPMMAGGQIRESVLANLHAPTLPRVDGRLVWVFSMMPQSGTYRDVDGNVAKIAFYVVIIDAQTGRRLAAFGQTGGL